MAAMTEGMSRQSKGIGGAIFLGFFALFWSSITLVFDGFLAWSAYCQIRAQNYAATTGVVTHSAVERQSDSEGSNTYSPNIKYKYAVAGKEYSGNRYRFGQDSSNDHSAQRIVTEHPVGKQVSVYYDPDRPSEALLRPGLEGSDLFMAMFLLPFNLVMLGLWSVIGGWVWARAVALPAGGVKVWDDGFQARVRLPPVQPFLAAAIVAAVTAFVATFVVGFGFGGFHPSMSVMCVVWAAILASGLLAYAANRWKLVRGDWDLVIDATDQQVTLPRTMGRKTDIVVRARDIASVEVQRVEKRGSRRDTIVTDRFVPTLTVTDRSGATRHEKLGEWWDQARAEAFAAWLRERLRIEPPS
jgi:hypothetical protein